MLRSSALTPTLLLIAFLASIALVRAADPPPRCASDEITLRTLAWTDAQQVIAGHKEQVVLVDIWTTTCPTCVEHFPEFVALSRRMQGRGLVCLSVNCDHDGIPSKPPRHYAPRVLEFLNQHAAHFENLLLTDPLIDFLNAAEIGATPTYLLYGRDGKLRQQFDGSTEEFTFDQVVQAVESEISARSNPAETKDIN